MLLSFVIVSKNETPDTPQWRSSKIDYSTLAVMLAT